MTFWLKIAGLFLIRSRKTSIVLTLMVSCAVCSLIFLASFAVGINDAMINNSVGLFSGHISGIQLHNNIRKTSLAVNGVKKVLKRKSLPVFFHSKGHVEMVSLSGIEPDEEKGTTAFMEKIIRGRFLTNGSNEILLSYVTADNLNVTLNDPIQASTSPVSEKESFIIVGIYKTGLDQFDKNLSFCNLADMDDLTTSWQAAIFLDDGEKTDSIIKKLSSLELENAQFLTWQDSMPDLEQLINLNYISMGIVIAIVFIIVSIGITGAFVIFVFKNIREFGIMKVMGVTAGETFLLLFFKVLIINIFASLIGVLVGVGAVLFFRYTGIDLSPYTSHNQYFVVSGNIYPRLTLYSVCLPSLFAVVFSLPAAIWPSGTIIMKDAAQIIRGRS